MDENCVFVVICSSGDEKLFQFASLLCRSTSISENVVKKGEEILEKNGMSTKSYDISHENC